MIPLKRVRTAEVVHVNFQQEKREAFNLDLMIARRTTLQNDGTSQSFLSNRWREAKPQLLRESHNKCAYCEAPTAVVAFGDVEHYRPKSKYWWLAYSYDNYLASCQLCNQKYKQAKFRCKGSRLKAPVIVKRNSRDEFLARHQSKLSPDTLDSSQVEAFEAAHRIERPWIVNPYIDNPADWFAWEANDTLRWVTLVAAEGVPNAPQFVRAAEQDLGLNRIELQELRYAEFEKFRLFKRVLQESGITLETRAKIKQVLQNMIADDAPFAGMLRFFDGLEKLRVNPK